MKTAYEILGVAPDSDDQAIKKAYRRLAKKYHPDHNSAPDAAERFKEIDRAYNQIKNAEQRAIYESDLKREQQKKQGMGSRRGAGSSGSQQAKAGKRTPGDAADINFADLGKSFESIFGFNPKTKDITDESKLNKFNKPKKDPFNSDDIFSSFFGFKR